MIATTEAGVQELLAGSNVLRELGRLHDERQTGVLTLNGSKGNPVEVFLREGVVEAVSSGQDGRRLGDYLARNASVEERDLDSVESEATKRKVLFGEALVRRKLVGYGEITAAVQRQSLEILEQAVRSQFAVHSFSNCLRSYAVPAGIEFAQVLLELARTGGQPFEPKFGTQIVLTNHADLGGFAWSPEEISVLAALKRANTFRGLSEETGFDEATLRRILGVLRGLGAIEVEPVQGTPTNGVVVRGESNREFPFENLIPVLTRTRLDERLQVARDQSSFTSEQFKNLKVQLSEARDTLPLTVITVSSAAPQDGKSFVSLNLALSFSMEHGRRTILVDCDLRSPSVDKYLGIPPQEGLVQYLTKGRLAPHCYMRRFENLYVLTAGGVTPNPIELLSMRKMTDLIAQLRKDFDTIILDAPPYSPIADARVVAGLSDGLIMVVRRGKTTYASADRAFKAIDRNKFLGVVFNDVKQTIFSSYQDLNYYYAGAGPHSRRDGGQARIVGSDKYLNS